MTRSALLEQLQLLPERLAWHVLLALVALGIGIAISVPLAIACTRVRILRGTVLALAGMIQTVPSLALLALMVLVMSTIGFWPAIVALVLYSILPILRNTVTGIQGVDPFAVEAARGVGMTDLQLLTRVQLPLAAPVIIAGIRTAAVWVVGIATLSTPVGQPSLGNYIFEGLQLRNTAAIVVGVASAALLALVMDLLIRLTQEASQRRSRLLAAVSLVSLTALFIAGLSPLLNRPSGLVVGAKTFTEQYVLAELLTQQLHASGIPARKAQGMGSTILFESVCDGSVDCYVDYSGTLWSNVLKRTDTPPSDQLIAALSRELKTRYGVQCLGPLGFENTYALAMRRDLAEQRGIKSISDLARWNASLKIGGDYEFFGRPEWKAVQTTYGLRSARTVALDSTLMYRAVVDGQVDAISAFSTDGRISAYDLVVLRDDEHVFPPYDAVLLLSAQAARRPELLQALQPVLNAVSVTRMRQANQLVDVDGRSPAVAAQEISAGIANRGVAPTLSAVVPAPPD